MGTILVGHDAMVAAGKAGPFAMPDAPDMPVDVAALLDKLPGLDRRRVLAKLRDLTDATKTVTASFMGQITDSIEVADNPTQLAATRLALEMHRLVGNDGNRVSIGTVNILWAGGQPAWAKPSTEALVDASVNANANDSVSVLNSNETESTPALSTIEGTGRDRGGPPHTRSDNSLSQRVSRPVKKRGPRLPVYRGEK